MRTALQDEAFRNEWAGYEQDPGPVVFLAGCQRSGTTLLHLQLARSGAFRFVSAHDAYAGDRLFANHRQGLAAAERERFVRLLANEASDRGLDSIPASPDTPEEYGLLTGDSEAPELRYEKPDTTEATLPRLRALCAKKAAMEGRERPLLLKNPPDYSGAIPLLATAFPEARFVAVQRHPLATLHSQVASWRAAILRRNGYLALIDPAYRGLFEDSGRRMRIGMFLHSEAGVGWLAECILKAHLGFLAQPGVLQNRLLTIRYEDLCADQAEQFRRLSAFFGQELPEPVEQPSPRERRPSEEVLRAWRKYADQFRPYLDYCGYEAGTQ